MVLFYNGVWRALWCLHLCHRFVFFRIKDLPEGGDLGKAVATEGFEKPSENHLDPFQEGLSIPCGLGMLDCSF